MAGDLSKLQEERDVWVARNFPGDQIENSIFGAVEEVGELAHHYLKRKQGIRGEEEFHRTEMGDAIADAVIFLAGVASHLGLDYGVLVQQTWDHVKKRDWIADPQKGGT